MFSINMIYWIFAVEKGQGFKCYRQYEMFSNNNIILTGSFRTIVTKNTTGPN